MKIFELKEKQRESEMWRREAAGAKQWENYFSLLDNPDPPPALLIPGLGGLIYFICDFSV